MRALAGISSLFIILIFISLVLFISSPELYSLIVFALLCSLSIIFSYISMPRNRKIGLLNKILILFPLLYLLSEILYFIKSGNIIFTDFFLTYMPDFELTTVAYITISIIIFIDCMILYYRVYIFDADGTINIRNFDFFTNFFSTSPPAENSSEADEIHGLAELSTKRKIVIVKLRERSTALKRLSSMLLASIASLIISGVVLIIFSGNIVSNDAQSVSKIKQIQGLIAEYEEKATSLRAQRDRLANELEKARTEYYIAEGYNDSLNSNTNNEDEASPNKPNSLQQITDKKKLIELKERVSTLSDREISIRNELNRITLFITSLETQFSKDIDKFLISNQNVPSDVGLLIASAATRFGILLVIIFLVQILVGVYRYSAKMAAFYESRFDSLLLISKNTNSIKDWADSMMPDMIDFGKVPAPPQRYVVDGLQAFWGKQKGQSLEGKTDK